MEKSFRAMGSNGEEYQISILQCDGEFLGFVVSTKQVFLVEIRPDQEFWHGHAKVIKLFPPDDNFPTGLVLLKISYQALCNTGLIGIQPHELVISCLSKKIEDVL